MLSLRLALFVTFKVHYFLLVGLDINLLIMRCWRTLLSFGELSLILLFSEVLLMIDLSSLLLALTIMIWHLRLLTFLLSWINFFLFEGSTVSSVLLLLVIDGEIVKDSSHWLESCEDEKNSLTNLRINLLAITTLADWLVLIQWIFDMDKLCIWDIFDPKPLNIN